MGPADPYGGGIAKVLNENVPGIRATAEVTAASVDNLKLIRDNKADIAFALADTLADAVAGRGAFAGGAPVPAASLAVLYSNYTQVVTLAMMLTWKYTMPAFLVPFVFTLSREGLGVLLQGSPGDVVTASLTAAVGVGALAAGFGGWIRGKASAPERGALICGGLLLFYAARWTDVVGSAITLVVLILHIVRQPTAAGAANGL